MCYLIYKIHLLHSKISFRNEHWMVEVMNIYLTFQMHEDDELIFNPNSEEGRYYVFLNLEFAFFFCLVLYRFLNEHVQFFKSKT